MTHIFAAELLHYDKVFNLDHQFAVRKHAHATIEVLIHAGAKILWYIANLSQDEAVYKAEGFDQDQCLLDL